jgi:C1A family cysteine protease
MKIFLLFLFIFSIINSRIFSQETPSLAPLNPDFVKFTKTLKSDHYPLPFSDAPGTGGMPPPGQVSFDDYLNNSNLKSASFASVYDMRTTGFLTPVRGQTANGCWAYATIASVESRWLVSGLGSWDLSENNLKYCHGFNNDRSYYGNHWMSTAYFARNSGPLIEADDPNIGGSPGPGLCPSGKIPVAYITDARYLPHDMNTIKQAILDQGAIYTMIYYHNNYYNASNFTYYYSGTHEVNHCIALAGWDDTKVTAGGTGAWICKNSYGIGWGEAGYFYVSYNDKSILDYNAYWPARSDYIPDSKVYGYDDLGNYESAGYASPVAFVLVKFIASGKQLLRKVGSYAMAANSSFEIDVFDNFNPLTKTTSGLLSHQSGLTCPMPGYYTFDLPSPLAIEQGNDFYIRIRYQTPAFNFPIPIEYLIADYAAPFIESNVAWMSGDGSDGSWFLFGNTTTDYKWDPCVKVYAESVITWNGNLSRNWNTPGNWSANAIPTVLDNISIPDVTNDPLINNSPDNPAVCRSITIDPDAVLTLAEGKALTVSGLFTNNSGITGLVIKSGGSLIADNSVAGTIESAIPGNAWHLVSAPVSNGTAVMFTGKYLQKHAESTNLYSDITATSEALTPLKGYALWGNASGFTSNYIGLLNSGNQTTSLTRTAPGVNSGWNLAGNPYPSTIDWDATTGWTKTNLNNAIYIEKNGGWASYIAGAGTNGGTQYIAPCQGFFVNVAGVGNGTLAMSDDVRVHKTTAFFKNTVSNMVKLQVSGNRYSDEAVIRFLPEATSEFDGSFDAYKFFVDIDGATQLYSSGSTPLSINTLPETSTVALGLHVNTSGVYTIAATDVKDLSAVSLEDIKTGIFTDLLKDSYSFNFTQDENEQRFVLHFDPIPWNKAEKPIANIFSNDETLFIDLNDAQGGNTIIYTITGQVVATASVIQGLNKISLTNSGNYIVKVISPRVSLVKKVWIQ